MQPFQRELTDSTRFFRILVCSLLIAVAVGATARAATVDQRTHSSDQGRFYVAFTAYGDEEQVGHAFVILYAEDERRRISTDRAFGLWPAGEPKRWRLIHTDGQIVEETMRTRGRATVRLEVQVDEAVYRRVMRFVAEQRSRCETDGCDYGLLWRDCVTFMRDVAQRVKLRVPPRLSGLRPVPAIAALIDDNVDPE